VALGSIPILKKTKTNKLKKKKNSWSWADQEDCGSKPAQSK
jgi:hypothetical protein